VIAALGVGGRLELMADPPAAAVEQLRAAVERAGRAISTSHCTLTGMREL